MANPSFKEQPSTSSSIGDIEKALKASKIQRRTNVLKFIYDLNVNKKKYLKGELLRDQACFNDESSSHSHSTGVRSQFSDYFPNQEPGQRQLPSREGIKVLKKIIEEEEAD